MDVMVTKPVVRRAGACAALVLAAWTAGAAAADRLAEKVLSEIAPAKATHAPKGAPKPKPKPKPKPPSLLAEVLRGPLADADEVVFALRARGRDGHWYANFAYWSEDASRMMYGGRGGRLCRLNLRTKQVVDLVNDPAGDIRDPTVHYDGGKVLFSYRKGGTHHYSLYEINVDGSGLTRLTAGNWDDIEPAYLPNGDIVWCSARCRRWVSCWFTQVAILYRMDGDGGNMRPISSNIEHDNTPAVLPDGRVLYTRWEYVDRSQVDFHHLWTVNPDGTGQMAYFGNMHPHTVMIDAEPIPGTDEVAAIFSPGHGANEHRGTLTTIDPDGGPDARRQAVPVRGCPGGVRDPCPLSRRFFLVAHGANLLLVDAAAERSEVVYTASAGGLELHEPCLVRRRPREPVIPDRADWSKQTGTLVLGDVSHGRNMRGVKCGQVRRLLVLETLPKPVNFSGGPVPLTHLGTFNLERALGTVPVEPDGSAHMELPANRPVFFVALDANDLSVKRMHSFVSVMPGETTSCVGCHETRTTAVPVRPSLAALRRPPSRVEPFEHLPDVPDFARDVQPILDRHCVRCHNLDKHAGGFALTGDHGTVWSRSYHTLMALGQFVDGRNAWGNSPPRSIGSSASPLMRKVRPEAFGVAAHHGVKVTPREWRTVWLWIETGATYAGTYAALGSGMVGGGFMAGSGDVYKRRCYGCHYRPATGKTPRLGQGKVPLPEPAPPGQRGPAYARYTGMHMAYARRGWHALLNLDEPVKSPLLLGPLARDAGGWGTCKGEPPAAPSAVFESTDDPDYQKLLAGIQKGRETLQAVKRFDMPGFRPNEQYVREMKRYGILPPAFDRLRDPIDVYATDRAYWRSLWWQPMGR